MQYSHLVNPEKWQEAIFQDGLNKCHNAIFQDRLIMHYFSEIDTDIFGRHASRRLYILNTLLSLLEKYPHMQITTAILARDVGISGAALYKHFSSREQMFSVLIDVTEWLLFRKVEHKMRAETSALQRCRNAAGEWLFLIEAYPGMACILEGSALSGMSEKLCIQHARLRERFEQLLVKLLRESVNREGVQMTAACGISAGLLMAWLEGVLRQFVLKRFSEKPSRHWQDHWKVLQRGLVHLP